MSSVALALAGAVTWSFLEYVLHRFVGHDMRRKYDFSREHLAHHADSRYFTPTAKKLAVSSPVVLAFCAAGWWLVGAPGILFGVGFGLAYFGYEVLHRRIHTHAPLNRYGRWARRHHLNHHHRNPRANHGVTSLVWDWAFGTLDPAPTVRVPVKHVMPWVVDPEGSVLPEYADTYEIARRRAA